jgi:hypothetical protein
MDGMFVREGQPSRGFESASPMNAEPDSALVKNRRDLMMVTLN